MKILPQKKLHLIDNWLTTCAPIPLDYLQKGTVFLEKEVALDVNKLLRSLNGLLGEIAYAQRSH